MSRWVKPIIDMQPPDPTSFDPRQLWELAKLGRFMRTLDDEGMARLTKMMTMSAVDFLDEWFESDILKAPMAVSGIIGTFLGVRSPGTAYVLLHHYMGEIDGAFRAWGLSKGGTGQISLSIASAARSLGVEIRTETSVDHIMMKGGQARGVVLENGDEIYAKTVVSSADPRRTFLGFVGSEHLDDGFVSEMQRYRYRGSSGKVNLALDRLPEFKCRPGEGLHLKATSPSRRVSSTWKRPMMRRNMVSFLGDRTSMWSFHRLLILLWPRPVSTSCLASYNTHPTIWQADRKVGPSTARHLVMPSLKPWRNIVGLTRFFIDRY